MSLRINDTAPDFVAETTQGTIKFHEWIGNGWAILFSHPKDFTPVCTTELGYMAGLQAEFEKRNCKIIGLSVDPVDGCTFWMTNEYYASQTAGNSGNWNTRIGSFKFPSCGMKTFSSQGASDGWVLESGETTDAGGTLNATATTFNLGDDRQNRQYRSVLSFDTSSLPDNAVVLSVVLKIKKAGLVGSNPFSTLGNIAVDLRSGAFNDNVSLELLDFQATADQTAAMSIANNPSSGWYSRSLSASFFSLINLTGTTQFRLAFATDDNNNHVADYLKFYSGNYTTASSRPKLVIKYKLP